MAWFKKRPKSEDAGIFLQAAERVFTELCGNDTAASRVYRDHPDRKKSDWKEIKSQVEKIGALPYGKERTAAFRGAFAEQIDVLATSLWYTNLEADDREKFAKFILSSTREVQDRVYYFGLPYHYMYASILEFIIFTSWDGDEHWKEDLREVQGNYMDLCRQHCDLLLKISRARSEGRQLTEEEKDAGKPIVTLREATRRALAGEKVFDE
jgi:hypothetical protein